ncbi:MAG: site-specific integrase, partial [Bacteroidales bacterium]|nr:site-specific integrase [Bacteroidales bacterium]
LVNFSVTESSLSGNQVTGLQSVGSNLSKAALKLNLGKTHGRKPSGKGAFHREKETIEVSPIKADSKKATFGEFAIALAERDLQQGRKRLAEIKTTTVRSFLGFTGGEDILIRKIDSDLVHDYEEYLQEEKGLTRNTSSFYLRNLRAIYNQAVKLLGVKNLSPFNDVYTGVDKTVKRALDIDKIRKIKALDLSGNHSLDFARDLFLMSFMLRGMSFVDMAFLKVTDLSDGVLHYRRKKTGQDFNIRWETPMRKLSEKWPNDSRPEYLLPIIVKKDVDDIRQYRTELYKVNTALKTIGEMIGAEIPLTMYVARHSWATVAKQKGVPIGVISEGMGHTSENTTLVYLGSMGQGQVDSANKKIIGML